MSAGVDDGSPPRGPGGGSGPDRRGEAGSLTRRVEVDTAHRVLVLFSVFLAGSVAIFAVVAVVLGELELFPPFLGYPASVRAGIGVFLVGLLALSYPMQRWAGGDDGTDAAAALSKLQTGTMVANAMRDAAGIMGCLLVLLSGDRVLGLTVAGLAVASILLSLPTRADVEAAVQRDGSGPYRA